MKISEKKASERVVLDNWTDIRRDPSFYATKLDSLHIRVSRHDLVETRMLPGERQFLRKAHLFSPNLPDAEFAAEWLQTNVTHGHPGYKFNNLVFCEGLPAAVIGLLHAKDESMAAVSERLATPSEHFHWNMKLEVGCATVAMARNRLLTKCLTETDGEVFVSWDDDMQAEPADVEELCLKALELDSVVSTVVSKRAFRRGWIPLIHQQPFDYPSDTVIELEDDEYAGAAMNAFPRTALERIAKHLPLCVPHGMAHGAGVGAAFYPFYIDRLVEEEDGMKWMTEDRVFCEMARKLGEKVYIWCKPRVAHFGKHGFSVVDGAQYTRRPSEDTDGRRSEKAEAGGNGAGGERCQGSGDGRISVATGDPSGRRLPTAETRSAGGEVPGRDAVHPERLPDDSQRGADEEDVRDGDRAPEVSGGRDRS